VVEHLASKYKALGLIPSTAKEGVGGRKTLNSNLSNVFDYYSQEAETTGICHT
jgi:hypothetical protein